MLSSIGRAAVRRVGAGVSRPAITNNAARYLSQLQRVHSFKLSRDTSRNPQTSLRARRSYATATDAAKPKATKATAKKTTKKTTTKKSVAKPKKKKVAAKKKAAPKKKVLTEEQKAALKEKKSVQKSKDDLKALKATSLIKEQPKNAAPGTAYMCLVKEMMSSRGTQPVTAMMAEAAKKWKSLSPSEIEHYNHQANENRATNEAALKKWIESYTPDQIREANNARRLLKDKVKSVGKNLLDDVRAPKRPRSAMMLFTRQRWASGDFKGVKVPDASKLIMEEWRELSSAEKEALEREAQADLERYAQEIKTVYNRDVKSKVAA
ncbi:hypothetical protein BP6252_00871 [Coleophoma cylindrospora]|uniref:HMG box domain-containing protein n=1 Tax=Coleophoma cylindrospora TaxID=1849047 RepID=A0A3D8SRA1_9HELO|nr:hypothetical protein BP6252_00871 [Coleophoma cylindrospora]